LGRVPPVPGVLPAFPGPGAVIQSYPLPPAPLGACKLRSAFSSGVLSTGAHKVPTPRNLYPGRKHSNPHRTPRLPKASTRGYRALFVIAFVARRPSESHRISPDACCRIGALWYNVLYRVALRQLTTQNFARRELPPVGRFHFLFSIPSFSKNSSTARPVT